MTKINSIKGDNKIIPHNEDILSNRYFMKREYFFKVIFFYRTQSSQIFTDFQVSIVICLLTKIRMEQQEIEKSKKHYSHLSFKDRLEQTIESYDE